jgi:hypothetical protein
VGDREFVLFMTRIMQDRSMCSVHSVPGITPTRERPCAPPRAPLPRESVRALRPHEPFPPESVCALRPVHHAHARASVYCAPCTTPTREHLCIAPLAQLPRGSIRALRPVHHSHAKASVRSDRAPLPLESVRALQYIESVSSRPVFFNAPEMFFKVF